MNATIKELTQGSADWLEYRRTKRNASESAAVMGLSPWCTPYRLWLIKTGRYEEKINAAMQRGTELEPAARAAYEAHTGLVMQPLVLEDGAYSASLDGMTLQGDLIVEIKCPMRGSRSDLWQDLTQGIIPQHYLVQIQHQLMVSNATQAHFWAYDGVQGQLAYVPRDEALIQRIREAWDAFEPYLINDTPPPLTEADTVLRSDEAWTQAALAYTEAKKLAEDHAEKLEAARKNLLALAQHPRETGSGVSVTRFWKAGAVAYKDIPELKVVDLDKYRSKAREEVRISVG